MFGEKHPELFQSLVADQSLRASLAPMSQPLQAWVDVAGR